MEPYRIPTFEEWKALEAEKKKEREKAIKEYPVEGTFGKAQEPYPEEYGTFRDITKY